MDPQTAQWDTQWRQLHPNEGVRPEGYHGESGGISSTGASNTSGNNNYIDIAKQMMELQKQANQPAIQSLQTQIPTTQQAFQQKGQQLQAEVDPLKQRYQSLIDSLTKQQGVATQRESTASAREFGARGIPLSSGAYDQYLNQRLLPVEAAYSGQIASAGFNREDALRQIQNMIAQNPIEQTQAEQQINQAIAQLQSGGNTQAIQNALSLYQQQQQANQQAQQFGLQQQIADREAQAQQTQLGFAQQKNPLELALLQAQVNKANQQSGGSGVSEWLQQQLEEGSNNSDAWYKSVFG